ncbi:MAG: transcriptional regulator NrdR [Patescibacteria group bacterium]|nr:transcriptional regulator NrdR [Patescibacteria group bacterium]
MKCPYCAHQETNVIDSRESGEQDAIRRRRVCAKCEKRFTTYERVEDIDLKVIKKDGSKEDFSREKLKRGITKATWKRPISMSDIDDLLDDIELKLRQKKTSQVKSWEVGNLVINRLRKLDPLSYLLFASVYRDFTSVADFAQELERLQKLEADQATTRLGIDQSTVKPGVLDKEDQS